MKKFILPLFFSISLQCSAALTAVFSHSTFNTANNSPYVETYLSIIGNSVEFKKNAENKYQASIEVSLAFLQNNEIVNFKKYNLLSEAIADSNKLKPNFLDIQRFSLKNGNYVLEMQIKDNAFPDKVFKTSQAISVNFPADSITFSSIELLEKISKTETPSVLTKSGYDLVPYVSSYFPDNLNEISFYSEIYNSNKKLGLEEKFIVTYYLESFENKSKMMEYGGFSRQTTSTINVVLGKLDITKLPSGNYFLVLEIRDKLNQLVLADKLFFQRSNPDVGMTIADISSIVIENTFVAEYKNSDTLKYLLKVLRPISTQLESDFATNLTKTDDYKSMQQYLLSFWQKRNAADPELAWQNYLKDVEFVNKKFTAMNRPGYTSDRGRVYLQYGEPDSRTVFDNEPSSYPYEVWQYYKVDKRTNRRFVFGNFAMAGNDYKLIHSDAIGEVKDSRWQQRLVKRNQQKNNFDVEKANDYFGGNIEDNYNNPR